MEEVFCSDCKYYFSSPFEFEECRHNKNKATCYHKSHYEKRKRINYMEKPHLLNKNNDCELFELKKWKAFALKIGLGARI